MISWKNNIDNINLCLNNLSTTIGVSNEEIDIEVAFYQVYEWINMAKRSRRVVYLIGNGGSLSTACHIATDISKYANVHSEAISDPSLLTSIGNDSGYVKVFSESLQRRMNDNDVLMAISGSGESPNILEAVRTAIHSGGRVITFSSMMNNNSLRRIGMLNFYVPADSYGTAEVCHAAILHHIINIIIKNEVSECNLIQ